MSPAGSRPTEISDDGIFSVHVGKFREDENMNTSTCCSSVDELWCGRTASLPTAVCFAEMEFRPFSKRLEPGELVAQAL